MAEVMSKDEIQELIDDAVEDVKRDLFFKIEEVADELSSIRSDLEELESAAEDIKRIDALLDNIK